MAATSLESHRSWILNLYESEHLSSAAIADYLNEYGVQTSLHEVQIHLDRWTPIRDPFPTGTVGREDDGSNLKTPSLNLGVMNHHGEHDISIAEPSETDNGATVLQRFMMTDQRHERLAYQLSVDEDIDLDDEIQNDATQESLRKEMRRLQDIANGQGQPRITRPCRLRARKRTSSKMLGHAAGPKHRK